MLVRQHITFGLNCLGYRMGGFRRRVMQRVGLMDVGKGLGGPSGSILTSPSSWSEAGRKRPGFRRLWAISAGSTVW
jgi:hypothetical protein